MPPVLSCFVMVFDLDFDLWGTLWTAVHKVPQRSFFSFVDSCPQSTPEVVRGLSGFLRQHRQKRRNVHIMQASLPVCVFVEREQPESRLKLSSNLLFQ